MLAIAIDPAELNALEHVLADVAGSIVEVVEPAPHRRVVLAVTSDDSSEPTAVLLRAQGWMAVTRPAGGAALRSWMTTTEPVRISDELAISLAWSEHDRGALRGVVELGPGGFGSGHHRTTQLLAAELDNRREVTRTVLDVGCGSGVLALCALQLGAEHAVAIDLKDEAVAAARANATLNGMGDRLAASTMPLDDVVGDFDAVLANIARAGIVALAPQLVAKVARGGWLAVSGITPAQCEQVAGFLSPLVEVGRCIDDGWAALVLQRLEANASRP